MDQTPASSALDPTERDTVPARTAMVRFVWALFIIATIAAAIAIGYQMGRTEHALLDWAPGRLTAALGLQQKAQHSPAAGPIIYYRDPDGKPFYASEPKKTQDKRDYVAVHASEDISFDGKPVDSPSAGGSSIAGKRILYYRNPMGLADTSPKPKKDSMGMDYIPVYEGEADDPSIIKISPGKLQRTGVRSEPASRRVVTRPVRAPASVKLDERRVAVVSMRADSFIDHVENVTTGDRVRKGQPLLRLYSPEISAASAQYLSVITDTSGTGASAGRALVLEGARRRLENLNVPPDVITEIERTRRVPTTIMWSAPRDGVVLERNAVDGMKATSGQVLFRLADISTIWVLADVPEQDLGLIKPGQEVTIRVRSLPGKLFAGRVALIYPQVSIETRTARVRVEFENPDGVLLPDMYADIEFTTGSSAPVVAVPDSAIIDTGTRQVVILDRGEGRFEPRPVKVGVRGERFVEIVEGVAEGDQVVVSANFLIDAESNLKAALQGMTGAPSAEEKKQ